MQNSFCHGRPSVIRCLVCEVFRKLGKHWHCFAVRYSIYGDFMPHFWGMKLPLPVCCLPPIRNIAMCCVIFSYFSRFLSPLLPPPVHLPPPFLQGSYPLFPSTHHSKDWRVVMRLQRNLNNHKGEAWEQWDLASIVPFQN